MKTMTYLEFAETLANNDFFDDYIQDSFWTKEFKTSKCLAMMETEAKQQKITLTNEEDFDYDKFFFDLYNCTEKGLS